VPPPLLSLRGIVKRFGEVTALEGVDLDLATGETLGLLGENGAGKTTLMNIAFGLYRADAGDIAINGQPVNISSTMEAIAHGVGMVHQHAHVVARHTVLDNLMVGLPGIRGRLDRSGALRRLSEIASETGLELDPQRRVSELAIGERQRLEIIKVLFRQARILILDEPTSVLTPAEATGLFASIRTLTAQGVGVVFISHKLNEVRAITNRIVVMRRGTVVAEATNDGSHTNQVLARLMCGEEPERIARKTASRQGDKLLEVERLRLKLERSAGKAAEVNLSVASGEIVGVAGVSGNGQVALAETVAGLRSPVSGTISIAGRRLVTSNPRQAQSLGLAYIPEDRIHAGLVGDLPVAENLVLSRFWQQPFARWGWLDRRRIQRFAQDRIAAYDIRPPDPRRNIGLLSGGNQQKAIVARETAFSPRVLIIAQPTRGLDVAATAFVHRELLRLRDDGCAILMISDDLDEGLAMSDRVVVMFEGSIALDLPSGEATVSRVALAMAGGHVEDAA
jgi:simple sugar transport system ATP-binding protein